MSKKTRKLKTELKQAIKGLFKPRTPKLPKRRRHDGRHWARYDWEQARWIIET